MQSQFRARFFFVAALLAGSARAQDFVEIVDDPFEPLLMAEPKNKRSLTYAEGRRLIEETLQVKYAPTKKFVDDPSFYCVIHTVIWKTPSNATDAPEIEFKRWYVFRGGTDWDQARYESARLYGTTNVGVLAIHWTQAAEVPKDEAAVKKLLPRDSTSNPANVLADLNQGLKTGNLSRFADGSGKALKLIDGIPFVTGYPPDATSQYRVEVTEKLPAPWGHLLTVVGVAQAGELKLRNRLQPIWSGRHLPDIKYKTSDVVLRFLFGDKLAEMDNKTFDNEGTYRFDFSAGFPVRSTKELKYDTSSGVLTATEVEKHNLYGLVNLFLKPVDVKTNYRVWPPSVVVGVGLAGRPWERPMIGLGTGTGKIAGFIGAAWRRTEVPVADMTGGPTLKREWDPKPKLVFGLNLTARQVADLLKPKK